MEEQGFGGTLVSIHLFMEGTLEVFFFSHFRYFRFFVSIHLFMEGTLEVRPEVHQEIDSNSFQSIYSWKVLWKYMLANNSFKNVRQFQSIYSWKVLWKSDF